MKSTRNFPIISLTFLSSLKWLWRHLWIYWQTLFKNHAGFNSTLMTQIRPHRWPNSQGFWGQGGMFGLLWCGIGRWVRNWKWWGGQQQWFWGIWGDLSSCSKEKELGTWPRLSGYLHHFSHVFAPVSWWFSVALMPRRPFLLAIFAHYTRRSPFPPFIIGKVELFLPI